MPLGETIAALSTPRGESAIAMVRLSGALAEPLACDIFSLTASPKARYATLGEYEDLEGETLDQVVFTYYPSKSSYTGEPMLEISTHGNPLVVQRILEDLVARGCRYAEPGEFTRTAFMGGKLDLAQAEAVADLIHARSSRALKSAKRQLSGALGLAVNAFTDRLLAIMAQFEARIDFPEEDVPEVDEAALAASIEALMTDLDKLAQTSRYKTLLSEGIEAIIVGAPNAGKSSFLNALLGEDRVLVSEEPGTTRDFVREKIMAGPYCINIVDTAGLRSASGEIESKGIEKTLEKMRSADFFLFLIDSAAPLPSLPEEALSCIHSLNTLVVENKVDLSGSQDCQAFLPECPHVRISAKEGTGIAEMRAVIAETLEKDCIIPDEEALVVSARHSSALLEAKGSLERVLASMPMGIPAELLASELREALESLGKIVGKIDNEQMLDKLFGAFCIGK